MTENFADVSEKIRVALAVLPEKPGVYLMRDAEGRVIYVGKAVVLKNRVRSYFRNLSTHTPKIKALRAKVADIETIVTGSEVEALILECNLIKKYRPRYNIMLKDDKAYPYLKVTVQEDFPRFYVTRKISRDGAKYYGPYADVTAMRSTVKLLRSMFPVRSCRIMNTDRPCLNYHIKRCMAPCVGYISRKKYAELVRSVCMVLEGRTDELESMLKRKMSSAAEEYRFEEAAQLRDQLRGIERIGEQQTAVIAAGGDLDIIGCAQDMTGFCLQIFFVRRGKLLGHERYFFPNGEDAAEEIVTAFIKQHYNEATFIPKEILASTMPAEDDRMLIEKWLTEKSGRKIVLHRPVRGTKKKLLQLADDNAAKLLNERLRKGALAIKSEQEAAEELRASLGLACPLERMDCFDISHTQGSETVASMVVFRNGSVSKKDYRKYKIVSAEGKPDDFKSMQEVVYRRYKDYKDLPDLVIIDGGKGQLSSALEVIRGLGLQELPVVGLAKREEEIFLPNVSTSIMLPKDSAALHLIQRIRDEAHRFAITYHRKLRGKRNLVSVLDHIDGIGPKRRQALWKTFKSLAAMKEASLEELAAVESMDKRSAQALYDFFRMENSARRMIFK